MKEGISISRVPCNLPNVCLVDVKGEDAFRLIGVYAPDRWKKAEILFQWADDQFLAQALPNSLTSLRSNRVIDYAFIRGFNIDIQVYNDQIVKESDLMCNIAADYYEEFFKASNIVRPHPYTDSSVIEYDNINEVIPEVKLDELINTVLAKKKKKSLDAHGILNYMFNFLDLNYWSLLLKLYNHSFQKRGLLPDSQSGFRERFRLQARLLLFLEDIYSVMSNSAPVCTMFVDFRAAFDQLWFLGCIGNLRNLGIPSSFLNWIEGW
ncbi:unnamed protein product, partial [Rotaria socialis]